MERIGGGDDHGVLDERRELVDARKPVGPSAREVRVALDDLRPDDSAPLRLGFPEVPEADERVVGASTPRARRFPAPGCPRTATPTDPRRPTRAAGVLHLVGEGVEDADHDHAVGAAVEAAVHGRRDLMAAVEHARVREDDDAARGESRREIPLPRPLQPLERPALAQRLVLGAVQLVDLLLQTVAVELHRSGAGRSAYAFSAPTPTQKSTSTIPSSSDVVGVMTWWNSSDASANAPPTTANTHPTSSTYHDALPVVAHGRPQPNQREQPPEPQRIPVFQTSPLSPGQP